MSIVLGIGDPVILAEWERQMRGPIPVPAGSVPRIVGGITHIPYAGDPPPPDIGTGHYQPPPVPQGWQCPLCRTVYAPSVTQCECDIPPPIPDNFVGLGKPKSVTPVRIRVIEQEADE